MKKEVTDLSEGLKLSSEVVVSCRNQAGENNALVVAYATNCSFDPPMLMVGIVPSRYSYHMLKQTGAFVVNLVSEGLKEEFDYLGSHSGRNENKLEKLGLNIEEGKEVDAPVLTDFPVNIECEVMDSIMTGSHEMFAGEIRSIRADEELVKEGSEIDISGTRL